MLTLQQLVAVAFEVMRWLIIIRVFLSWIPHNPRNPLINFVYEFTEPIMAPFRRLIPPAGGAVSIDFSPIIAILALIILESLVIGLLNRFI